jgi:hypothetical protein
VKYLKNLGKAFALALLSAAIMAIFLPTNPVRAQPTGNEMMFANPAVVKRTDLHVGDTFTINITVANMTTVDMTTLACSLYWDPYYLNLTTLAAGDCLPAGVLLIGDWNSTLGYVTDATYGTLGGSATITVGTMLRPTFKIMHPGSSVINVTDMNCYDFDLDQVLSGDSPYDCNVDISEFNTYAIVVNSTTYYVETLSNSTITVSPTFDIDVPGSKARVFLNVTGQTGTAGYANITIPKALLDIQAPWTIWWVVVDSANVTMPIPVTNTTCTFLYVPYTHSEHMIQIWGNKYVPEFPTITLLLLMLLITAAMFIFVRKVHKRPWQTPLKR